MSKRNPVELIATRLHLSAPSRRTGSVIARVMATAVALVIASCAVEPPLEQTPFAFRFAGAARDTSQPLMVQSRYGWSVTLTAAEVSIGPIYFYNNAPSAGTNELNGTPVAQVLAQFTVDALNPGWGEITGATTAITQRALSAELRLFEATDGPIAVAAGPSTAIAHVAGRAQRLDRVVSFDATLRLPLDGTSTAYAALAQHQVRRISADFTAARGGTLSLTLDASRWFEAVEFLNERGEPVNFSDRISAAQLLAGIASAQAFQFTWQNAGSSR
jgi:hypothetical protein